MSTRSGKRLHGSPQPSPVACAPMTLQSERKTRNKKQKENEDVAVKKKHNYVSYPADEDTASVSSGTTEEKPKRRTRRNTLKEHNIDLPVSDDVDNNNDNKKNIVKTRRGNKIVAVESAFDVENNENTEDLVAKQTTNGKKKNKKKKNQKKTSLEDAAKIDIEPQVILKKKHKKKNKSSITERQDIEQNELRILNMSADSFHSASGSPHNSVVTGNYKANISMNSVEPEEEENLNATFDKTEDAGNIKKSKFTVDEKINVSVNVLETGNANTTFNKSDDAGLNTTWEKKVIKKRQSSIKNSTFDKAEDICGNKINDPNVTFDKVEPQGDDVEPQNSTFDIEPSKNRRSSVKSKKSNDSVNSLNTTFDRKSKSRASLTKRDTIDKDNSSKELNTTFDTEKKDSDKSDNDSKKSSLISSDSAINVTFDKSNDNSSISITSDESKTENILNYTPVLIESSIDESHCTENSKTPENSEVQPPVTPLKREGTFTKEGPDETSPKVNVSPEKTPVKRKSLQSPGRTPFPLSKSAQKDKSILNVTRSIEKSLRRSSLGDIGPRQTKVMFCSPVNSAAVVTQIKGRIIKSNLKGSNKSFVFDDSVASEVRPAGRKRSFTHNEADTRAKRKRLADDLQHSVDRLSRPRTVSATAKLPDPDTPSKKATTPSKAFPARTRLPNFAALHQKQFARMESLDECQRRRARRAQQLLTPTGSVAVIERISPKGTPPHSAPPTKEPVLKLQTPPKSKLPTLASLNPGYTRFGFKLNVDVNPFSVPAKKTEIKRQEERPNGLSRQTTCLALPSLAGATATRRDVAKQTVMREKSFTEKRDVKRKENRTIIKGVRTNRRFELQMKLRNINA